MSKLEKGPPFAFFSQGSVKSVLKTNKNSARASFVLALMALGFFVIAKVKTSAPQKTQKAVQKAVTPTPELALASSESALAPKVTPQRVFSEPQKRIRKQKIRKQKTHRIVQKKQKKRSVRFSANKVLSTKIETGLSESPQGSVFHIDPYESETLLDHRFAFDAIFPRELPVNIHEGVVVAENWQEIRKELLHAYAAVPRLTHPVVLKAEPVLVARNSVPETAPLVAEPAQNHLAPFKASVSSEIDAAIDQGKNILKRVKENLNRPTSPPATSLAPPPVTTHSPPPKNPNRNPVPGVEPAAKNASEPPENFPIGNLYGKLTFDKPTQRWLNTQKGHVEMRLVKVGSRDPQDQVFIDYEYPSREFHWDGREVKGQYQLVAQFFEPGKSVAVAEVVYPEVITEVSARKMAVFHIEKTQVDEAIRAAKSENLAVALSGTIFEANTADPFNEKPLGGALVSVVGFPDWGTFSADTSGFFRIPKVTAQSEFTLSVSAAGFYPTQVTVPVSKTAGYVSIHLVPKPLVETVTQFFTKRPQSSEKALIFGRLFDPIKRSPKEDLQASLVGRKGHALYFGALPDPKLTRSTSTGAFAFFNVEPALRSVGREGTSAFQLFSAIPGHAYYVESGRAGQHTLKGQIIDPYQNRKVMGLVKVVGSQAQIETNALGEFEINSIEMPSGILTLEVEAEGYPLSWHTLSWNPQLSHQTQILYMPEADLLSESRASIARVSETPQTGSVFGGAEKGFFENQNGCVLVTLEDEQGRSLSTEKGPYPLYSDSLFESSRKLCLYSSRPGFAFYNLPPGQYILKWKTSKGTLLRSHIVRVGMDRVSIVVN